MNSVDYLKRLYLKLIIGYSDPRRYFDTRWKLGVEADESDRILVKGLYGKLEQLMATNECKNFLDIGCGMADLRELPNYLGLDFSIETFRRNGLTEFVFADVTAGIPLASRSFDMVFARSVLLHIQPEKIRKATMEISRVTRKCIVLCEPALEGKKLQKQNFNHDLRELFKGFDGKLIFLPRFS